MKTYHHGQHQLRDWLHPTAAHKFLCQTFPFEIYYSEDFNIYWRMTAANEANCPYKVMPQFKPDWPGKRFWLEARDQESPIFAIAATLIDGREWLSMFPGKLIIPNKLQTDGKIIFNGGQWIAPSYRHQGLSPLTCKLLHAIALLQYEFDYIFALVIPEMHGGGEYIKPDSLSWRQGFRQCTPGITWTGYYPEPQHLSLIWMDRLQAVQSLVD